MEDKKNIGIFELKETSRTYFFSNGNTLTVNDAVECRINKINTHQLTTRQGEIYIVPYKWLSMKYIPIVEDEGTKK